jgi:hypothetical protein
LVPPRACLVRAVNPQVPSRLLVNIAAILKLRAVVAKAGCRAADHKNTGSTTTALELLQAQNTHDAGFVRMVRILPGRNSKQQ